MPQLDGTWARDWITESARVIGENREHLNTLDRDIGDGDHGENLNRGFHAVVGKLVDLPATASPGDVLKLVATTLISTVGGAAGPLYGTAFLKAAVAVGPAAQLGRTEVIALLTAARDGIVLRGKAELGDKTMIDSWTPAVDAARLDSSDDTDLVALWTSAADAAAQGAIATEPLVARKGRASYLGERAIGHRDPGAESTTLMLRAAATVTAQHMDDGDRS